MNCGWLIGLAMAMPFSVLAQTDQDFKQILKPVLCGPVETIFQTLLESDINETPIWTGKNTDGKSDYAIFMNSKSGAFTIVQFGKEIGCILGIGPRSQILNLIKS